MFAAYFMCISLKIEPILPTGAGAGDIRPIKILG